MKIPASRNTQQMRAGKKGPLQIVAQKARHKSTAARWVWHDGDMGARGQYGGFAAGSKGAWRAAGTSKRVTRSRPHGTTLARRPSCRTKFTALRLFR